MVESACDHSQHHGLDACPGLTPEEIAYGEKVKSVALNFVGSCGRDIWHGRTNRERIDEMFANAKKYGNGEPEYVGRRWV